MIQIVRPYLIFFGLKFTSNALGNVILDITKILEAKNLNIHPYMGKSIFSLYFECVFDE